MMNCTLVLWARINPFCYIIFVGAFYHSKRKRNKSLAGALSFLLWVESEHLPLKTSSLFTPICVNDTWRKCLSSASWTKTPGKKLCLQEVMVWRECWYCGEIGMVKAQKLITCLGLVLAFWNSQSQPIWVCTNIWYTGTFGNLLT